MSAFGTWKRSPHTNYYKLYPLQSQPPVPHSTFMSNIPVKSEISTTLQVPEPTYPPKRQKRPQYVDANNLADNAMSFEQFSKIVTSEDSLQIMYEDYLRSLLE